MPPETFRYGVWHLDTIASLFLFLPSSYSVNGKRSAFGEGMSADQRQQGVAKR